MNLVSYILIGIAAMLCLAIGIILFVILYQRRVINHQIQMRAFNQQKQLELMQASVRSEEQERMRIASELHDDVGATLSSIRLFLHQAERNPGNTGLIRQSKELLDESIQKIRDLSHQLQPGTLQYLGLPRALQSLAEMITRSGSVQLELVQQEQWEDLQPDIALSVYRIIQELVNNCIKHSDATWIRLLLHVQDGCDAISLAHNGHGLTEQGYQEQLLKKGAIGLKNIETRLKSANIRLVFQEMKDEIYTVTLRLPIPVPVK